MKYYENICNCLRVIQQDINRKFKSANCWQQTSLNDFVIVFPNQTYRPPNSPCLKIGQCQPRVIIYINFEELGSLMLYAKFQDYRITGSGEADF